MLRVSNVEAQVLTQSSTMPVFSLETHASFSADILKNKKKNTQQVSGRRLKGFVVTAIHVNTLRQQPAKYWFPQLGFLQMVTRAGDTRFKKKKKKTLHAHGPRPPCSLAADLVNVKRRERNCSDVKKEADLKETR